MAMGIRVFLVLAICLAIASCSGSTETNPAAPAFSTGAANPGDAGAVQPPSIQPRNVSLQAALADLADLPTPPDVDSELFETLRSELEIALTSFYSGDGASPQWFKAASAIDPLSLNGAWCLNGRMMPSGEVTISWRSQHLGDYDLNSEVNVADITPLVLHYQANPELDIEGLPVVDGKNESSSQVDGDKNGEVNVADITQIALNFSSRVVGYRLYPGTSTDGTNFVWDNTFVPNVDDPGAAFTTPFNSSLEAGVIFRYSATFNYTPEPGVQLYVRVVPFDGTTEGPEQIIPVPEGPHAMFECSQCHFVTSLDFRGPEASCHNCHSAPPEDRQTSWADTPGVHSDCMLCHAEHGFAIAPAESVCGDCHSSAVTEAASSGMTACLTCHDNAHLPNAAPATTKCATCHTTEAAEIAATSMTDCSMCHDQHSFGVNYSAATCTGCHATPPDVVGGDWASSPGMHGQCESCHGQHSFAIAQPNTVCSTCHQAKIDAGHAFDNPDCLSCHVSPHIPEVSVTGMNCTECHPNPPENLDALWEDAPGDHATCVLCHNGPEHPNKPTPPESICGDCHTDPISAGHITANPVCLDCHTFPHLPELQLNDEGCMECHPDSFGPGHHPGSCLGCHPNDHTLGDPWSSENCLNCHDM